MSTTRGIAFTFIAAAALLLLGAAPCDAARGAGGARTTSCPALGASALANPDHMVGGAPSPIHGTGDEPASNAKMRRHTKARGAAVGGYAGKAVRVLPIAPPPHASALRTSADKERRAVVVVGGEPSRPGEQFGDGGYGAGLGCRTTKPDSADATTNATTAATCSGGEACPAAVKIDAVSVPAPPLPLSRTPGAGKVECGTSVEFRGGGKGCTAQPGTTGRGGHAFLRVWSEAVLSIVSVAGVGVASLRFAGRGSLISHGARALSHRRQILRSAMVGFAVMSSEGAGVSAAACTATTCCNVAIPKLDPLTTTTIDRSVCSEGT
jgi:hypothetical protein